MQSGNLASTSHNGPHIDELDRAQAPVPEFLPDGLVMVLVRHAERVVDGTDPALSAAGRARARLLARMLGEAS